MKPIKITDYFKIIHPTYVYLKITPDTSIRNYNSTNIANTIAHTYKSISKRIRKESKKLTITASYKFSFFIDIHKSNVDFYFIVPEQFENITREKIREIWNKATIDTTEPPQEFTEECLKYQLCYKKEDALSLNVDKKSNEPLNSILSVLDILQDKDRIGVFYNFIPRTQAGWLKTYTDTIKKIKNKELVDREKVSISYILKTTLSNVMYVIDSILNVITDFLGADKDEVENQLGLLEMATDILHENFNISTATKKKKNGTVLNTQILILSQSEDDTRKINNAVSVCQAYGSISENNELVYKPVKSRVFHMEDFKIAKVEENITSTDECQNFIQIPGRDLLNEHKNIKKIDTLETEVPLQLQNGVIRVGKSTCKGNTTEVYQTEDKELKNTSICICGPNRSGKSTLIANIVKDVIEDGRSVILPDFCGKCQLSDELAQVIPENKIININCNDWDNLQGFGYNEIVPKSDSVFELYDCAKKKASKLKEFINLVNGDSILEGRMERFLECAALITFICNGSVNDVFKVLKSHVIRHKYIDNIPKELNENTAEYVEELCEIDEYSKATKDCPSELIGTKQSYISAILSRVYRLKENTYIEMMLKKSCENNINLIDEMQKGKLICIRMYDNMFVTQQEKDIYVSYWITKIWGALQKRFCDIEQDKLIQTVILIDELSQVKSCERYLTSILSQMPKYRTKLILSCHHLAQIPVIQEELKSAMCSYMFIAGSNKKNFLAMKEEFEDKGYTLEDLLHLKRHHALCLLAYEEGYWAGITKLPLPVK